MTEETVRERDVPQEHGYGQLLDIQSDPATGDLLGGSGEREQDNEQRAAGGGGLDLFSSGYVQYGGRDGSDDTSSSSTSSSGESSDSDGAGSFDPFTRRKEEREPTASSSGDSFGFFSNPHGGGGQSVEEENLLGLSLEEAIETRPPPSQPARSSQPPRSQPAQSQPPQTSSVFDPFGDWGSTNTTTSGSAGATFANFGILDLDPTPSSSSSVTAPASSTNSFDPFSSANSSDLHDLMAPTPLLPTAESTHASMPRSPSGGPDLLGGFGSIGQQPMARAASWNTFSSQPPNTRIGVTEQPRKVSDPFANLGDLTGLSHPKPSQTSTQQPKVTATSSTTSGNKPSYSATSSKPSYQLYGSHTTATSTMNNSRSPSPRGAQQPSVVGGREERGPRTKVG